ncbi:hypothetical protein ENBRE01_0421 [Enteropsectra breve]|nr:hypothetical protein ENBRE01_0421 [Enteropsectra breve]
MTNTKSCIDELICERDKYEQEIVRLENLLFRQESALLDLANGTPLTKSLDFYLNNKIDKKRTVFTDEERIFISKPNSSSSAME